MNITKLIKGGMWFLIFSILAKGIVFFNKIYLTKHLSVSDFGLFVSMFSLMSLIFTFNSFGLSSSMVKFIPEYKIKTQYGKIKSVLVSILTFELVTRVIIFITLFLLAPYLAEHYFKSDVTRAFRIFIILILTEIISRNLKPFYKSFKETKTMGLIEFFTPSLYLLFFYVFFKIDNSIYVPILSYILTSVIIGCSFGLFSLKTFKFFKYKSIQKFDVFKKMLAFGLPLIIANTGGMFISYFDTIMLTALSTLENVAIYNVALSSVLLLSFVFNAVSITLIPTVSELNSSKKFDEIKYGLLKLNRLSILILIPVIIIGWFLAKWALGFFYGSDYIVGDIVVKILLIGVIFVILNNNNIRVLIGTGNTKSIAKVTWISAGINVVLNIPFILLWGINGAAIATSISYLSQYLLTKNKIKNIVGEDDV